MGITINAGKIPAFQRIRDRGLKCREEKLKREQNRDNEVAVLEKQKAALKNKECTSLEEIGDKLGLFHSYEDQIKAVKHAFNSEQMCHIVDEAREKGEKIAEELKKLSAKTPEEMKKILEEEALGIEKSQGMLSELLEEITLELPKEPDGEKMKGSTGESSGKTSNKNEGGSAENAEGITEILTGKKEEEIADRLTKDMIREAMDKTQPELPERESEKLAKMASERK